MVNAAGVPIGVTTCWEVIFDRAARESVLNGAQLLAVPTNNALFGEAMSEQQLAFGRLRAVEHDRYVVVAGTTGISAVIAPDGQVLARTAFFEPAYLDAQVRLKTQFTPGNAVGPDRPWACWSESALRPLSPRSCTMEGSCVGRPRAATTKEPHDRPGEGRPGKRER